MFRVLFISLVLLLSFLPACRDLKARKDVPKMVSKAGSTELALPQKLESEISHHFPYYELPSRSDFASEVLRFLGTDSPPYVASGDFNGDNLTDTALILKGKNDGRLMLVAFHQIKEGEYVPYIINEMTNPSPLTPLLIYIQLKSHGKVDYIREDLPQDSSGVAQSQRAVFDLKADGITFSFFGKASELFYWKNGKYERLLTGD